MRIFPDIISHMKDHRILGLPEEYTLGELKAAFRKKSKELHPDKNRDSYESHLAMIRLNRAYENLRASATRREEATPAPVDDEYELYRQGISLFQNIHPSKWKKVGKNGIDNAHAIETDPETIGILDILIRSMTEAYYCFSRVVNEYPQNSWTDDSRRKLREIEKMTVRYSRIRESYAREK